MAEDGRYWSGEKVQRRSDSWVQDMQPLAGTSRQLRRHGDEFERLPNGYYKALGRCDDTMNLGGIKVSALPPF